MNSDNDMRQRRCPRLGGEVSFAYCRSCEDSRQPCFKIIDCWWETFDVVSFVKEHYSEDVCRALFESRPKPKVNHLLELIEAAKKRMGEK